MLKSHRTGFSLQEMLVVISIIVLLIALLFPNLAASRSAGRMAVCQSNLHQMGIAFRDLKTRDRQTVRSFIPTGWQAGLSESMGDDARVFQCPEGGDDSVGLFGGAPVAYVEILLYGSWRTHMCEPSYFVRLNSGGTFPATQYTLGFESSHGNVGGGGDWDDLILTFDHSAGQVDVTLVQQGDHRGGVNNSSSNVGFKLFSPDGVLLFEGGIGEHPPANQVIGTYKEGGGNGFDYGINNRAQELVGESGKILVVDYTKLIASVVGPDAFDVWKQRAAPRHFDKLNALFYGGHVELKSPDDIDPEDPTNNWKIHNTYWRPDNDPLR